MNWRQLGRLLHLARATPAILRRPTTRAAALDDLKNGQEHRGARFLESARRLIYANPASPYRRLLEWAGCAYEDLSASVSARGVDGALAELRDAGVWLTLEEFKRTKPVVRPGLDLAPLETDFDPPVAALAAIGGTTSGSRAAATRVMYDWNFIAEEASHELLLYDAHGVLDAPLALWYPVLPGVAGVHNLLMNLKTGRPPERWFSQIDPAAASAIHRFTLEGIRWSARTAGLRVPAPEYADLARADKVLDWMVSALRRRPQCVVRTYVSSAVRLAGRARERGIDPAGAVLFAGGEPLTGPRRRFIEAAGFRVFPRYVATEPGLLAAACPRRIGDDDMHVYTDRVAVIPGLADGPETPRVAPADSGPGAGDITPLLVTTLSLHTAKVLLNVELGDSGRLETRSCGCVFGEAGFNLHVSDVGSGRRLTLEGMTVAASAFEALLAAAVESAGGAPDSFQYWTMQDDLGLESLVVAVSPEVGALDPTAFAESIYTGLERGGPGLDMAGALWRQAGTIRVVREAPRVSRGSKLPAFSSVR